VRVRPADQDLVSVRVLNPGDGTEVDDPAWDQLARATAPIGTRAWVRSWLEVHGSDHDVRLVTASSGGALAAVVPLARRRGTRAAWEMLGVRQLREPTDVLGDDVISLQAVADRLAGDRLPLALHRLPADSLFLPALRRAYAPRSVISVQPAAGTPTIGLDDSWREPTSHFNSGRRSDFRSARRRADQLGRVEFSVLCPGPGEVDALVDDVVQVEGAGWKAAAGTALSSNPQQLAFFRSFCRRTAAEGVLRLAFLRIDGRAMAVQLAVEEAGRYALLKIGYDESVKRISPGTLLMLHTVQWAAERGLRDYDFLGAEEPWTAMWSEDVRPCVDVRVHPASPSGAVAAGLDGLSWSARALRWSVRRVGEKVRRHG